MAEVFKLEFYVPEDSLEKVKEAVFDAGAGKIGLYGRCCWQTPGNGQFLPLEGSSPHTGKINIPEKVKEYKVELVCSHEYIEKVLRALLDSHPYETPAYQYWKVNI
jgi:hypothetical protein